MVHYHHYHQPSTIITIIIIIIITDHWSWSWLIMTVMMAMSVMLFNNNSFEMGSDQNHHPNNLGTHFCLDSSRQQIGEESGFMHVGAIWLTWFHTHSTLHMLNHWSRQRSPSCLRKFPNALVQHISNCIPSHALRHSITYHIPCADPVHLVTCIFWHPVLGRWISHEVAFWSPQLRPQGRHVYRQPLVADLTSSHRTHQIHQASAICQPVDHLGIHSSNVPVHVSSFLFWILRGIQNNSKVLGCLRSIHAWKGLCLKRWSANPLQRGALPFQWHHIDSLLLIRHPVGQE